MFDDFREKLDNIMIKTLEEGRRVVLYGYGRTGQFLEWYAEYYHSIEMDYIITVESTRIPNNFPLFRDSLLDFNYKGVKDAIIWLAVPADEKLEYRLEAAGYIKWKTYFPFYEAVYENDYIINEVEKQQDVYFKKKRGIRDIQFMEYLEYAYGCNLVETIWSKDFEGGANGKHSYVITTEKEIFPILDKCHCIPQENDAIFDFGCGKGGALIAFLNYGFKKVGGVEFEKKIYEILVLNFNKIGISLEGNTLLCINGDAVTIKSELDDYNWFYYFDPFDREIFEKTIKNIEESLKRNPRKIHIININPKFYDVILQDGFFVLTNQFEIATRQKVVDVFVTKKEFE